MGICGPGAHTVCEYDGPGTPQSAGPVVVALCNQHPGTGTVHMAAACQS